MCIEGARPAPRVPPALRLHASLRHPSGTRWPAMVAAVWTPDGGFAGVHRTFLAPDGQAKAAVEPAKLMLGHVRGGGVRLAEPADGMVIGEGIGSTLSAMLASGRPGWAALSTSGLKALELPAEVRGVTIVPDGDDPGRDAAQAAALRWKREGREVRIAHIPSGRDANDMLHGGTEMDGDDFDNLRKAIDGAPAAEDWPEPEPLPARSLSPVRSFEPELLPAVFAPWVTDIAERMQCPLDYPAVGTMIAAAALIGRRVTIRPKRHDDWTVVPNVWGALVGPPAR